MDLVVQCHINLLLNDNKVIKIETPKDGNEYTSSIKEMYPDDIENKAINFQWKDDTLIKEVRNYYSDLKDKSIYYVIKSRLDNVCYNIYYVKYVKKSRDRREPCQGQEMDAHQ